jgi:hypothetical protein
MIYLWSHYSEDKYKEPPDYAILDQPIHSNFTANLPPEEAEALYQRDLKAMLSARAQGIGYNLRHTYPSLGLTLCNIHTGEKTEITHIGFDRFGVPQANFDGITSRIVLCGPGLCVVEHWVQVSEPTIAARWALHHLHHCVKTLHREKDAYKWRKQDFDQALIAAQLSLNRGLLSQDQIAQAQILENKAVQLAFF